MLHKVKTCFGIIRELLRIYITDRNSEVNKSYRYFDRVNYRNFLSLFRDRLLWSIRQNFTSKGRSSKKKLIELNRWITPDARRSFKLDTIAPHELLATHQDELPDLETLRVDPDETITEESIFTLAIDFRALWKSQEQSTAQSFQDYRILRRSFSSFEIKTIAQAPDKGHYSLLPTKDFRKSLRNISKEYQERILSAMSEISANPFFAHGNAVKPLSHQEGNIWRKRVGDYRIIYSPIQNETTVILIKVDHRSSVYRGY
jgi:mRNA interferase RelE/StbE